MEKRGNSWYLYFCSITVSLFWVSIGCMLAWNSPVIPKLLSNNTDVNPFGKPITVFEQALVTSIFPAGRTIAAPLVGKVPDLIGRKTSLIWLSSITFSSYIALCFASHIYVYLIFSLLNAICLTGASIVVPNYTAEIAENHNRGRIGALTGVCIAFGQFYVYLIGPLTTIKVFCIFCSLPQALFLILSFFIPESPIYLHAKGYEAGTIKSLKQLRKPNTNVALEMVSYDTANCEVNNKKQTIKFWNMFKTNSGRRAFNIALGVCTFQQSCGIYIILAFLGLLLNEAGGKLSGHTLAVIVAVGKIIVGLISLNVIDRYGRKVILLISSFMCGCSMLTLGAHFYLKQHQILLPDFMRLVPIISIMLYVLFFTFGIASTPNIIVSEVLPNEYRSIVSSVIVFITGLIGTVIAFAYPIAAEYLGTHHCMFIFGIICISAFVIMLKYLPETKGKSFAEIQKLLAQ